MTNSSDEHAGGLSSQRSRGDKTPNDLLLDGVRIWEHGIRRLLSAKTALAEERSPEMAKHRRGLSQLELSIDAAETEHSGWSYGVRFGAGEGTVSCSISKSVLVEVSRY